MTAKPVPPAFRPGPLSEAYARLLAVYAPTRRHREVGKAIERMLRAAGTVGGHQGLAIVGPTGSGKTAAVEHAERWLRSEMALESAAPSPLPTVLMTTRSSGKSLANTILNVAGDPVGSLRSQSDAEMLIKAAAPEMRAFGIAIDEFHHAFAGKSEKAARLMAMSVKTVVNSLAKPVIVMGIDGLEGFIDADPELKQRFESKVYLEDPRIYSKDDISDMRMVLTLMKDVLPCEASCSLDTPDMLIRLLVAAQCRFGSVVNRVRKAAQFGAMEGQAALTLKNFSDAYCDSAVRHMRTDSHNPFLLPIDTVKSMLKQMQDDKDRGKNADR